MAYIVPSDLSQLALAGSKSAELETLSQLKAGLPDAYTVFHGVHWSRSYQGGTCYGEIDFVVINLSGDVLLIEQKNGRLEETGQGLVKTYGDSQKNVGDQIRRSLENIREKFKWQHGNRSTLKLDYLIYCPDHNLIKLSAAGLDRDRVVDAKLASQLNQKIEELLGPGKPDNTGWVDQVERFFRQSFELVPDIHAHLTKQEKAFTRLSGGLAEVINSIEMSPFRLRIQGTAGCGKTLVVQQVFEKAVAAGKRPLLVCFSRSLRERLKARVGDGGLVQTWHGFIDEFLKSKGHRFDYDQMKTDREFWNKLRDQAIDEASPDDRIYDSLIVDEGQDFEEDWLDVLKLFLKPESDLIWLEDPDQDLYGRDRGNLEGLVGYRTKTNYRSPESIARFIRQTLPFEFENANDLPGLGVGLEAYQAEADQPKIVGKIVAKLVKLGFGHDDIVILTCRGFGKSIFSDLERVGAQTLRRFTGDYDMFGNQVSTKGQILFDSIYRFKGQQAPAVILVDVDPSQDQLDRDRRILYCGMTRATVRLDLVYQKENKECAAFRR